MSNIIPFYAEANIEIKRKLLGSIFPEQLFFSKEKSRTTRLNEAVRLIIAARKDFRHQKTGQLFKNLMLSSEVETVEQKSNRLQNDLQSLAKLVSEKGSG